MPTIQITRSCAAFLLEMYDIVRLNHLILGQKPTDIVEGDLSTYYPHLYEHFGMLSEMCYCRLVDNYLTYLADLLSHVFEEKPLMLKSKESMSMEQIMTYGSIDELVEAHAEKKVIALTMMGVGKLGEYLESSFGIQLFPDKIQMSAINEIVEIRNLVTHNRGLVNRRFLANVRSQDAGEEDRYKETRLWSHIAPGMDSLIWAIEILHKSAISIDRQAVAKFRLPTQEIDLDVLLKDTIDKPLMSGVRESKVFYDA